MVAIDEIDERHRFAAQGVDDVAIIDDVPMFAARMRAATRQRHQLGCAEEAVEPIVMKTDPKLMPDQARGDRVEDLAQGEAA